MAKLRHLGVLRCKALVAYLREIAAELKDGAIKHDPREYRYGLDGSDVTKSMSDRADKLLAFAKLVENDPLLSY
jgi:hypothetical protein